MDLEIAESFIERAGFVFDIDGTLANSEECLDDPIEVFELEPLNLVDEAYQREQVMGCDVVYLTGRGQELWTATRLWLNNQKLFGTLICRPTDVCLAAVSLWKARVVGELMRAHRWLHVSVWEDNPDTLRSIQCIVPKYRFTPTLVVAATSESNITGLSDKDVVNFKILMGRLSEDPRWKKLLLRRWKSKSELLDAAMDYVRGKQQRREFRRMTDELWGV